MPAAVRRSPAGIGRRRARGIPLGRIGGIPVVLSVSWLVSVMVVTVLATPVVQQAVPGIAATPATLVAAGLGVLLGVSVLLHELGHCLAARSIGVPVLEVRLYLLGGVSALGRLPDSPREEAVIAAAGPGVSALLAGIFGLLVGSTDPHTVPWLLLIELALANLVIAVFNFLPALPLDGGRVLRAGVWRASGRRRLGTLAAVCGGYLVAVALLVWGATDLSGSTRAGMLQGAIAVVMALFVGVGAAAEQRSGQPVSWPAEVTLGSLATPVLQLPAECSLGTALQAAAGRDVLLTSADGIAVGLLDSRVAASSAGLQAHAPASTAARPVTPDMVIFAHDDVAGLADRVAGRPHQRFLLVDDAGQPVGVVLGDDLDRILGRRRDS